MAIFNQSHQVVTGHQVNMGSGFRRDSAVGGSEEREFEAWLAAYCARVTRDAPTKAMRDLAWAAWQERGQR